MPIDSNLLQIKIAQATLLGNLGFALFAAALVILGLEMSATGISSSTALGIESVTIGAIPLFTAHVNVSNTIQVNSAQNQILKLLNSTNSTLNSLTKTSNSFQQTSGGVSFISAILGLILIFASMFWLDRLKRA